MPACKNDILCFAVADRRCAFMCHITRMADGLHDRIVCVDCSDCAACPTQLGGNWHAYFLYQGAALVQLDASRREEALCALKLINKKMPGVALFPASSLCSSVAMLFFGISNRTGSYL